MGKLRIVYKDVAVGSGEDAEYSSASAHNYSDISALSDGSAEEKTASLSLGGWILDSSYDLAGDTTVFSFMSNDMSNDDCTFNVNPIIQVDFDEAFTSRGVTFEFSKELNRWVSELKIQWYNAGGSMLDEKTFYPDSSLYFCGNTIENFRKIVITFVKTSLPLNRALLNRIYFGTVYTFGASDVRNAVLQQEGDTLSNSLSTSTFNWTLDRKEEVDFLFQTKQEVEVYDGNRFLGLTYIKSSQRKSFGVYEIENEDAIGLLELEQFDGKVYNNTNAVTAINEIINGEFNVYIDGSFQTEKLTGYIPAQVTKREALRQICFALGACVTTMGTNGISIFPPAPETADIVDISDIFEGQTITTRDKVTAITLEQHSLVRDSSGNIEIGGVKYTDNVTVKTKVNEELLSNDKPNVLDITGMTLVNASNVDKLLDLWYNQEVRKRDTAEAKIVLGNRTVGDYITIPTLWGTSVRGNINKMTITLSNLTVADVEVK